MIVSLLMTIEGSQPVVSRTVNVEDSMDLGTLAHVIDAAFGFSGGESHMYMASGTGPREVITTTPGEGERAESDVTVAGMKPMTYVYDPSADWNIHVEVLGTSRLDGPTPLLIDALGPDVVEACNGPALMGKFHVEARRIAAGLDPDMEVAPLLLSFLPVMSPERLLQRLSQADPVTVAERISFVAEDLMIDSASTMPEDPRAPQFAAEFEEFLDSRPDLQEIIALDPNPEHNPALISAMAEFFEDKLGPGAVVNLGPPGPDEVHKSIVAVLSHFVEPVTLTATGSLPTAMVKAVGRELGAETHAAWLREASIPVLTATCALLTSAGLLHHAGGSVGVSDLGMDLVAGALGIADIDSALDDGFSRVLGAPQWRETVRWLAGENGIIPPGPKTVPPDLGSHCALLRAVGVLEVSPGPPEFHVTPGGRGFIKRMLAMHEQ